MIKKAFNSNKEISDFQKNYITGNLDVKNIDDFLIETRELNSYLNFKFNKSRLNTEFKDFIFANTYNGITYRYGTYDFLKIDKKQEIPTFVLKFHNNLFIVSDIIEVCINQNLTINSVIDFDKKFQNLIVNFYSINQQSISSNYDKSFNNFKNIGLINNGLINFDYFKKY